MSLTTSYQIDVETDYIARNEILSLEVFTLMVPQLAVEIERARLEANVSTEEMLLALREEREKYVAEKYYTVR